LSNKNTSGGGEWDEEVRELSIMQLKSAALECIDDIAMIDEVSTLLCGCKRVSLYTLKELNMLEYRDKLAISEVESGPPDTRTLASNGIKVIKTSKVDGEVVLRYHFNPKFMVTFHDFNAVVRYFEEVCSLQVWLHPLYRWRSSVICN